MLAFHRCTQSHGYIRCAYALNHGPVLASACSADGVLPRIQGHNTRRREISNVARHYSHAMYQCGRSNESIALGLWIRDMQLSASTCNGGVDGQNTLGKCG